MHRHEAGHAAALDELAAHRVPRPLRRHHDDVDARLRLDQPEMHVQPMREGNRRPLAQVVVNVLPVSIRLQFIGHRHHQHVRPLGGVADRHDFKPLGLGLLRRGRALAQPHRHVLHARVPQVQRMRMALAAVADHGHLLVLDQVDVAVAIVIDPHSSVPPRPSRAPLTRPPPGMQFGPARDFPAPSPSRIAARRSGGIAVQRPQARPPQVAERLRARHRRAVQRVDPGDARAATSPCRARW